MKTIVEESLKLLGLGVKDKITHMEGIVTSITFDLYGCVQALVNPGVDKDGELRDQLWFDINRLLVLSNIPVMKAPKFADIDKGPTEKPAYRTV